LVRIERIHNRIIKLFFSTVEEAKQIKKFTRIYNPVLRFTKPGRNGDTDCKTSILFRNEAWIGELDYLVSNLKKYKMQYKIMFDYIKDINKKTFMSYINSIKLKYNPRNYQLQCIYDVLKYHYVTGESITGTGKSLIISILAKIMIDKKYRVLIIVPKVSLVEQMYNDMINYFGESFSKNMQKINGDYYDKMFRSNIIISTWQTLQNKADESFLIFDCVVADECDIMRKYDSKYRAIVMNCLEAKYVLGMTGTMDKPSIIDYHNVIGVLGKHRVYTEEKKMMEEGIISKITIQAKKIYYPENIYDAYKLHMDKSGFFIGDIIETRDKKWFSDNIDNYDISVCDKKYEITDTVGMTKFKSGDVLLDQKWFKTKIQFQREIEFISSIKIRMDYIVNLINSLDGNVLILTSFRVVEALKYVEYLDGKIKKNILYIDGSISTKERSSIFDELEKTDNNVLIALKSTMDRGVSVNNLQHFIMLSSIKNASSVRQMIGRVIRLDGKNNHAIVYDITDCIYNVNDERYSNSMKHYIERKKMYKERHFELIEENIKLGEIIK